MNTCPNCGMVKGIHASILPGCMCRTTPQNTFTPDWDAMAVMVEEQQRMAKRIEELEAMLERQTARIVDLQTHIENLTGEE
jgi:RNA polymerase subunit RPABC4/transcription elongation factor Spt4